MKWKSTATILAVSCACLLPACGGGSPNVTLPTQGIEIYNDYVDANGNPNSRHIVQVTVAHVVTDTVDIAPGFTHRMRTIQGTHDVFVMYEGGVSAAWLDPDPVTVPNNTWVKVTCRPP